MLHAVSKYVRLGPRGPLEGSLVVKFWELPVSAGLPGLGPEKWDLTEISNTFHPLKAGA